MGLGWNLREPYRPFRPLDYRGTHYNVMLTPDHTTPYKTMHLLLSLLTKAAEGHLALRLVTIGSVKRYLLSTYLVRGEVGLVVQPTEPLGRHLARIIIPPCLLRVPHPSVTSCNNLKQTITSKQRGGENKLSNKTSSKLPIPCAQHRAIGTTKHRSNHHILDIDFTSVQR